MNRQAIHGGRSQPIRTRKPSRVLCLERLEQRQAMAGEVLLQVNSVGDLVASGDAESNGLEVRQTAADTYQVSGLDRGGSPTLLRYRNQTASSFEVSRVRRDLVVNLHAGDDRVVVAGATSDQIGDVSSRNRAPRPRSVISGNLIVSTHEGDDLVELQSVVIAGETVLQSGSGADTISISETDFGSVRSGPVAIYTGRGSDSVKIRSSNVQNRLTIQTGTSAESERDVVSLAELLVGGDLRVNLGAGNNDARLLATKVGGELTVESHAGHDALVIESSIADRIFANLGAGSDSIHLPGTTARVGHFQGEFGLASRILRDRDTKLSEVRFAKPVSGGAAESPQLVKHPDARHSAAGQSPRGTLTRLAE